MQKRKKQVIFIQIKKIFKKLLQFEKVCDILNVANYVINECEFNERGEINEGRNSSGI